MRSWGALVRSTLGLACVALMLASTPARAESPGEHQGQAPPQGEGSNQKREVTGWISPGIGSGRIGSANADVARIEGTLGVGHHLFSVRFSYVEEAPCAGIICLNAQSPLLSDKEVALLYGWKHRMPYLLAEASIGGAALWTVQRGADNPIHRLTGGGTAELGVFLTSRVLGIGPTVIVDVNPVQSFWAALFDVHIGWMGSPPPWDLAWLRGH